MLVFVQISCLQPLQQSEKSAISCLQKSPQNQKPMLKYLEFLYFLSIARKRTAFRFMASWPNNGPRLFVNVFTLSNDIILLLKPTLSASALPWEEIFFKVEKI